MAKTDPAGVLPFLRKQPGSSLWGQHLEWGILPSPGVLKVRPSGEAGPFGFPLSGKSFLSQLPTLEAPENLLTGSPDRSNFNWSFLQGRLPSMGHGVGCVLRRGNSLRSELDLG